MADLRKFANTSNLVRFVLVNSSTGAGLTALTSASSGLIISTIADDEATATAYTVAGSTIETISTLGTFATPTATKCRFKEVDATNHPGLYEFQFADARFAITSAKRMVVSVTGAASLLTCHYEIALVQFDPYDAVRLGLTAIPNVASGSAGAIVTSGTGTAQLSVSSGLVTLAGVTHTGAVIPTVTTLTNLPAVTTNWLTGTGVDATAVTKIQSGLSTYAGGDTSGTTTLLARLTSTRAGLLDNLDAAVSTRSTYAGGAVASVTGNVGGNVTGSVGSVVGAVGSVTGSVGSVTGLTTATIATAVWTDTTAGDFTTATSPGKIIFAQLGGAFSTTSSSVFSTASLANAPTGGSAPTAAAIATAVWQDTTAGDFTVASSIGKSLYTSGAVPGASGGLFIAGTNAATVVTTSFTTTFTGSLTGSVGSVTGAVGSVTGAVGSVTGLTASAIATAVLTTQMTESYNVDGTAPTLAQAQFVQMQRLTEFSVGSSTITVKKLDGTTTAYTLTMDAAASSATSSTRGT